MSSENIVGGSGVVRVGPLEITITPLSQSAERLLWKRLREAAKAAAKAVSMFEGPNVACLLGSLQRIPDAYLESVRELTRLAVERDRKGVTTEDVHAFRFSPAGVTIELYERGKQATPGLDYNALKPIITEVNVDDVAEAMIGIVEVGDPKAIRSDSPN